MLLPSKFGWGCTSPHLTDRSSERLRPSLDLGKDVTTVTWSKWGPQRWPSWPPATKLVIGEEVWPSRSGLARAAVPLLSKSGWGYTLPRLIDKFSKKPQSSLSPSKGITMSLDLGESRNTWTRQWHLGPHSWSAKVSDPRLWPTRVASHSQKKKCRKKRKK